MNHDDLRSFLDTLDASGWRVIESAMASRYSSKRKQHRGGRPVIVKKCPTCQKSMSSREMWVHKCATPSASHIPTCTTHTLTPNTDGKRHDEG